MMRAPLFVLALAAMFFAIAPAASAMNVYNDGWQQGDPNAIRIGLANPAAYPRVGVRVAYPIMPGGRSAGGQLDLIVAGDLKDASKPYLQATYLTGERIVYSRPGETLSTMFSRDLYDRRDGEDGEADSAFGTVDYQTFELTERATGTKRGCGLWNGYLSGNTILFRGLYCPAGHAPTVDEMKNAILSVKPRQK